MRRILPAASLALLAACAGAPDRTLLAEGERQFQRCFACHSMDPAETGLSGPPLAGIVGAPAAAQAGFDYSPAMRKAAAEGLRWTGPNLDAFLADPAGLVPGTSMSPTGLHRGADRQALIAYLSMRK